MGDTSYGSCCVDEVAAEHLKADLIVHYGRACLSPTSRLPVQYIFGKKELDVERFMEEFQSNFPVNQKQKVIVFYDVFYHHLVPRLETELLELGYDPLDVVVSKLHTFFQPSKPSTQLSYACCGNSNTEEPKICCGGGMSTNKKTEKENKEQTESCCTNKTKENKEEQTESCCGEKRNTKTKTENENKEKEKVNKEELEICCTEGSCTNLRDKTTEKENKEKEKENKETNEKNISGRSFFLENGTSESDYAMVYIGEESTTWTNLILTYNENTFFRYSVAKNALQKESLNTSRYLLRRYYLVQKAKDANIIGLVVATLGVERYRDAINYLKDLITKAGKKHYLFVVGKLNPAKLANFEHIDVFTIIACPENSLIDYKQGEFYKPIITPFELELALDWDREWTGEYITDFRKILPKMTPEEGQTELLGEEAEEVSGNSSSSDDDAPRFSLIDGTLKQKPGAENSRTGKGKEVATMNSNRQITSISTAGDYLKNREWKGLEQKIGETEVRLAVEGREGIPMAYTHEVPEKREVTEKQDT
eukprot:CAMPEP_0174256640 /NCGR_PEP_ID=MMETSP0439-20130205/5855_1 /TAXON_ID=0 /ORGANISM="Stereomyxa ramosa, Strain Chinc5" /LENGTH=536 /DNA_ID=CAMNT_0015339349 /DNA_START=250 /DNA_END=1860 /DNA_ORIENTATION=+